MGFGAKRVSITIAITGATQQGNLPLSLGEIDHIIITSTEAAQSFDVSIINENSDVVWGPRNIVAPENGIRPALLPVGILTVKIANPVPEGGTVTVVAIPREK